LEKFALRTIFLVAAVFIPAVAFAMANLPFAPISPQPDYVVTMAERLFAMDVKRSVTHHGDWTRVDRIGDGYRFANYYFVNGAVAVDDRRSVSSTFFSRGGIDLSYRNRAPRNTGERQTHLGETCAVWEVSRSGNPASSFHLSCVTDDGIELWQRSIYDGKVTTDAEATRVERRPVTVDEVKPPRTLLTVDWWDQIAPTEASAISGYEIVLELSGQSVNAGESVRTTRQRGPWQSIEETVSGVRRRLEIVHNSDWMNFEYVWDETGAPKRLTITRPASATVDMANTSYTMWIDMKRSETILGETCRWFYLMTNGVSGRSRCLTNDRVVLKDRREGRTIEERDAVQEWIAVRMTRRPVSLDEIKPPAELLDPRVWGIE
jgi:hypothetical protein